MWNLNSSVKLPRRALTFPLLVTCICINFSTVYNEMLIAKGLKQLLKDFELNIRKCFSQGNVIFPKGEAQEKYYIYINHHHHSFIIIIYFEIVSFLLR